jgi:hypothetical protein
MAKFQWLGFFECVPNSDNSSGNPYSQQSIEDHERRKSLNVTEVGWQQLAERCFGKQRFNKTSPDYMLATNQSGSST